MSTAQCQDPTAPALLQPLRGPRAVRPISQLHLRRPALLLRTAQPLVSALPTNPEASARLGNARFLFPKRLDKCSAYIAFPNRFPRHPSKKCQQSPAEKCQRSPAKCLLRRPRLGFSLQVGPGRPRRSVPTSCPTLRDRVALRSIRWPNPHDIGLSVRRAKLGHDSRTSSAPRRHGRGPQCPR